MKKGLVQSITLLFAFAAIGYAYGGETPNGEKDLGTPTKLNWFIPDGVRAEPDLFKFFQWAKEGKLPNFKRLMDMGSYGYSIPVFPSHTPTNFAALLTGTYPIKNGIADGPMRVEGQTLQKPAIGGFSSSARMVPAIWSEFAKDKRVVLISLPGSTPPELKNNAITLRGRWGGWGADFNSIVFERQSVEQRKKLARNSKLFFQGMELTQYISPVPEEDCPYKTGDSESVCLSLNVYGSKIYGRFAKSNNSKKYDRISFSTDGNRTDATLTKGTWSNWYPITATWNGRSIATNVKFRLIAIGPGDFFRIRVLVDNLNSAIVEPPSVASELMTDTGPMVDFVDNFPQQLVYYPEDKEAFLSESKMSFSWHARSVDSIYKRYNPDIFIHDIYSPNQMLTSRWWMGYIDPSSSRYDDVSSSERKKLWSEVLSMYQELDAIIGKVIKNADKDTLIVFSSDHGAVPLDQAVQLNNLFAKKGWINYSIDQKTGEHQIDWEKSKVVFLKMSNIYVNPQGLGPQWKRGEGPEYDALRNEVIEAISSLKDEHGTCPLEAAVKWENAPDQLHLPASRIGDIVVVNKPGFGWSEDITVEQEIFTTPIESGYKQAIFADNVKGLWTPFIIAGKGIKKNYAIPQPIRNVDQAPTILKALGMKVPDHLDGKAVNEVFE